MATTSNINIDTGSTVSLATVQISEDALTKEIGRSVLNDGDGNELGGAAAPLKVNLAEIGSGTLASVKTVSTVSLVATVNTVSTVTLLAKADTVSTVTLVVGVNTVTYAGLVSAVANIVKVDTVSTVSKVASVDTVSTVTLLSTVSTVSTVTLVSTINTVSTVSFVKACVLTNSVDTIGAVKDAGINYTPVNKYLAITSAGTGLVWDPTASTKFILTDVVVSVRSSSLVSLLAGTTTFCVAHLYDMGGAVIAFKTPYFADVDTNFVVNSTASTAYVTAMGYESA